MSSNVQLVRASAALSSNMDVIYQKDCPSAIDPMPHYCSSCWYTVFDDQYSRRINTRESTLKRAKVVYHCPVVGTHSTLSGT